MCWCDVCVCVCSVCFSLYVYTCMYTCVSFVCVYIHVYTYMTIHTGHHVFHQDGYTMYTISHLHVYSCVCACTCVSIRMYSYVCSLHLIKMHLCIPAVSHFYVCMYVCVMYLCSCACMHMLTACISHTYIYTYTCIHRHIHTCIRIINTYMLTDITTSESQVHSIHAYNTHTCVHTYI
jgi:hypothetical protein